MISTAIDKTASHANLLSRLRLAGLTRRQTQCLSLYYFDGLSQTEIGVELGVGQRSVSQHLAYGRKKLAAVRLTVTRRIVEPPQMAQMDIETLDKLTSQLLRGRW